MGGCVCREREREGETLTGGVAAALTTKGTLLVCDWVGLPRISLVIEDDGSSA